MHTLEDAPLGLGGNGTGPEEEETGTPLDLEGAEFDAAFASDLEPVPVRFKIAGHPCVIWLRPMDDMAADQHQMLGVKYRMGADGKLSEITEFDTGKRNRFLVAHTVTDYTLWTRPRQKNGTLGDWQEVRPSEDPKQAARQLREVLTFNPRFWDALVRKCEEVNGMTEKQRKNSAPASDS